MAADVAPALASCDSFGCLLVYSVSRLDLAICIICALAKEPTATHFILEKWRRLPEIYETALLQQLSQEFVTACASTPRDQGALSGLASVAKDLGVLKQLEQDAAVECEFVILGLTWTKYALSRAMQVLYKFLSTVCMAAEGILQPRCLDARSSAVESVVAC